MVQRVLATSSSLSDRQCEELKKWWKTNFDLVLRGEGRITIPLCNHYVDFELKAIRV